MKDREQNGIRMLRDYPSSLIKGRLMCVVSDRCIEKASSSRRDYLYETF